jgi:hypothetical protein
MSHGFAAPQENSLEINGIRLQHDATWHRRGDGAACK